MRALRTAIGEVAQAVGLDVVNRPKTTRARLTERLAYVTVSGVQRRIKVEINLDEVPAVEAYEWILWTDRHLDLAYAQLALDSAPSKRRQRFVDEIERRLTDGSGQCPVHERDGGTWRRCAHEMVGGVCPDHGRLNG